MKKKDAYNLDVLFEADLNRRILSSERRRASAMALCTAFVMAIGAVSISFFSKDASAQWEWVSRIYYTAIAIGCLLMVYEITATRTIDAYLKKETEPPKFARYVNAFVEVSFPTLILIVGVLMSPAGIWPFGGPTANTYFIFIILSALRMDFWLCFFTGAVAAASYAAWCLGSLYFSWHVLKNSASMIITGCAVRSALLLVGGSVAGLVAMAIRRNILQALKSTQDRQKIINLFGQHVSPRVVEHLLAQPGDLNPQLRSACIFVLDIRDFTSFSENTPPGEVVGYLNALWGFVGSVINRHDGIINKYLGDGFMAVFGVPLPVDNPCRNALHAAQEILTGIRQLEAQEAIAPTRLGISLHMGEVVVGNIGSYERKEYTVIGDVVNVSFRIEELNKKFGSQLLISEDVVRALGDEAPEAESMGHIAVKGRGAPIHVYKLNQEA